MTSLLLGSSLLALVLLVSYLANSLKDSSIRQWEDHRAGSVVQLANSIENELLQAQMRLEVLAASDAFQTPPDSALISINLNGIPLESDLERRNALSWLLAEADHGFNVLFVLLPNGDHYISHPYTVQQSLQTYNLAHRPYFKEAQRTHQPVLSDSFIGADGIPAVAIDIPILNTEGEITSHLGGVFHLTKMVHLIKNSGFAGPSDTVFLLDGKGALIGQRGTNKIDIKLLTRMVMEQEAYKNMNHDNHTSTVTFPAADDQQIMIMAHMRCHWDLGVVTAKKSVVALFEPEIIKTATLGGILLLIVSGISLFFANRIGLDWQADERKRQTSHEHTEATLSERENFFTALTNQTSEGITVADTDGNYTFVNPAFCKMMGYSKEELLQMTVFEVKSKSQDKSTFAKSKASNEGLPITVFLQRKDGSEFFSEVVGKMIHVGSKAQVLGTIRDITERLQHDEEKLILERQVQHAQKLESLGILAGGIAHDFNNLLMAILGNADLARTNLSPMSPAQEYLLEIETASRRAADLAHQMLAYSGKGRFVIQPIGLGTMVREMAHLLSVSISKKVKLQFSIPPSLPHFDGDITQIRQVILNLITNASEAIGDKVGVINLSAGIKECNQDFFENNSSINSVAVDDYLEEGTYVYFEVSDTGDGMDNDTMEKIFDPFFTTKFTGRGLGMSAVQGIVRGHKGIILVDSEVGNGSTFQVLFPVVLSGKSDETLQPEVVVPKKLNTPVFDGTILIVDDEIAVRKVAERMLSMMGFDVLIAEDGLEALKIFREHGHGIKCVLLDLTMPKMDGEETYREIRMLRPDATVILCSGFNEYEATEHFEGLGLAGFIQKPFTMGTLQEKLVQIFP